MDAGDAVECLIELASTACLDSNQVPLSLLFVSVRALLERIRSKSFSSSSEDLAAFSQLTTLSSVRLWVECRQHPPFASPDSWPHLVLLELSNFCSGLVTQTAISNHAQASVERAFALVHKHACAQVPVLWDSFLASLSRQETSPLTRVVVLRLLHLAIVVQPKLRGKNPTLSKSLVGSLLSHLSLQLEHLLQDAPFTPREEAAVLTMGMVSTLNLLALGDDCNDYWLTRTRYCTMALELVDWMYRERGVSDRLLHSLYEWTSMATWLFSLHGFVKFLDFSEVVAVVLSDWFLYADERDGGWRDLAVPTMIECPEKTLDSLEGMLTIVANVENPTSRHLVGLILKSSLFLASTVGMAEISKECWVRQRGQRETLFVLFFYSQETHVQQDIIEYMFLLDGLAGGGVNHQRHDVSPMTAEASNGIPDIKWWQRAIDEAISRLHSHMSDKRLDSLRAMDTLISLLIYALRHLHPSPDVDQNLRATLCRLVEEMYTDPAYYVAVNLQQNAQVLCSAIRWPSESPLVANLSVHLDHLTSNQPLSKDDTFLFTQHILLLAEASLLFKCSDDETITSCYILFDQLLAIQDGPGSGTPDAESCVSDICAALRCLVEGGTATSVDFLRSSPWLFTVRLMLRRVVEPIGEAVQLGGPEQAIRSLLATLESCASGTVTRTSGGVRKRQLELKRSERGSLVFFVE